MIFNKSMATSLQKEAAMNATLCDLIEEWNKACDELDIKITPSTLMSAHDAAEKLENLYESQFRQDRSFKSEERMRYWRMMASIEKERAYPGHSGRLHPEYKMRRDEYIHCLRRNRKLKGFLMLTYLQQILFGFSGMLLLVLLTPIIAFFTISPQ